MTQQSGDRPFTGAEFLESLRDGREVWIYGERIKDVTTHPAFRNAARMIARMYDALHDPERKEVLTAPTDTGNRGFTHRFYKVPHSVDDLVGSRDAIAEWARISYGWDGPLARLQGEPDRYAWRKRGLLCLLSAERVELVPAGSGTLPVPESRADKSAG